jgi:hypothetical protein
MIPEASCAAEAIDILKRHPGIRVVFTDIQMHGTPDPDKVSKAASHGCVRLTN